MHKEWGTGTRFNTNLYLGLVGNVSGQSNIFAPVMSSGQQVGIITPFYAYPLHPRDLSLLDDVANKFARYAWREVEIVYHATCGTVNNGGYMFALNTDIASMCGTRNGSHGSYTQGTPSLNYHLAQDTHMLPAVWESASMKWNYRGDRAWFAQLPGDDSGVTETLAAVELEQFVQVVMWNRNDANVAPDDLNGGHLELRGIIDFYQPRNSPVGLTSGSVGGTSALTSSTSVGSIIKEPIFPGRAYGDKRRLRRSDSEIHSEKLDSDYLERKFLKNYSDGYDLGHPLRDDPRSHTGFLNPDLSIPKPPHTVREQLTDSVILDRAGEIVRKLDSVKSERSGIIETPKRSNSKGPPSST
jgi:hypothetical protein